MQCSFLEYRGYKVIYRRYASLFFIIGTKPDDGKENTENELGKAKVHTSLYIFIAPFSFSHTVLFHLGGGPTGMLEFIHTLVECMDKWAGSICELDIMYQLEEVHFLVDEMVQNGMIIETNKTNVLRPIALMERESQKTDSMFR
jgi:AP-4 complex subunit sigma-1